MLLTRIAAAAVLLAALFAPAPAAAATFTVDSLADAHDDFPGDGSGFASGAGTTLRAAIEEANGLDGADEIRLPAGEYEIRLGEIAITDGCVISGAGMAACVLDAGRDSRVLRVHSFRPVWIRDLAIRDGKADSGAGILNEGGTLALERVLLKMNVGKFGGGIHNDGGAVEISDSYIMNNRAESYGAGGGFYNNGTAVIRRTTFRYNRTRLNRENGGGGGMFNLGTADLENATFFKNRGRRTRGGAFVNIGTARFESCTIWRNQARYVSAGLVNEGTASVHNSILAGNERVTIRHDEGDPGARGGNYGSETGKPLISLGHNLDSGEACGLDQPGDLSNTDPLLLSLRPNGGPVPTLALRPDSPAIDAGDPASFPPTDARGIARPADGNGDLDPRPDLGAFEFGPAIYLD